MRKLSLKNLKLEASEMLGRNQLKTVLGGYKPDGFDCAVVYDTCDSRWKYRYDRFQQCMIAYGCG